MKKIIAIAMTAMLFGMVMFMGAFAPASATENTTPAENKKISVCHATGSENNPYNKNEISIVSWLDGHKDHPNDIWNAFSYTTVGGNVVNVPAQGNTALLAFDDCEAPDTTTKVAKPAATYVDKCGTADDVFAVTPGTGYTVGPVVQNNDGTQAITVTTNEGFAFLDGSNSVTYVKPAFTNVDCDLPETGGMETAVSSGIGALVALAVAGLVFMGIGRRKATN